MENFTLRNLVLRVFLVSFLFLSTSLAFAETKLLYVVKGTAYSKGNLTNVVLKTSDNGQEGALLLTVMIDRDKERYNQCVLSGFSLESQLELARQLQSGAIEEIHCVVADTTDGRSATLVGSRKYTLKMRL